MAIKWYWIAIGVVAAIVVGYIISKSMNKTVASSTTTTTGTLPSGNVVETKKTEVVTEKVAA